MKGHLEGSVDLNRLEQVEEDGMDREWFHEKQTDRQTDRDIVAGLVDRGECEECFSLIEKKKKKEETRHFDKSFSY